MAGDDASARTPTWPAPMSITYELIKRTTASLYEASLRKVPADTHAALVQAERSERNPVARRTLSIMRDSASEAERSGHFVCSDNGIPVFFIAIGTEARLPSRFRQAISDGWDELVARIEPPMLPHITHPLTNERGYRGAGMPILSFDLIDGADHIDITCSPKALGSGRWETLETFSFPSLETIERFVLESVVRAGSQPCPPVVVGVGIGGSFDVAARLSKHATLRTLGSGNPDPALAAMEQRLLRAINQTGFGPMGTGGDSTAYAVHVESSAGHGYTPVAVSFNCWINRRTQARIHADGRVERIE
jgi:fumarate hydratase subunit alpha